MKKILSLCAIALLAGTVYAAHYTDISIKELKTAMASKSVTLLDANGSDSYKEGHIRRHDFTPPKTWPGPAQGQS
jgi:hypothetical protein